MAFFTRICILLFLCLPCTVTVQAQWQRTTNALRKRSETVSVEYKGKIYVFLGFKDSYLNVETSSEVFDPATKTWTLLASIPAEKAMTHQGVALIDDDVWHIGGRVGKHPGPLTSEIWIYNITRNAWRRGPMLTDPATGQNLLWGGGGAALLGRTLHVFGGFAQTACNGDQSQYHLTLDVDSWLADPNQPARWRNVKKPMPTPRNHFGTVVLGGKIYAVGGQLGHDCGGGHDRRWVHVYDPATNAWQELGLLPSSRSHTEGSTFAIDKRIYLVAGQGTYSRDTNLVTVFNPDANYGKGSWAHRTDLVLPGKYEGMSAKIIGNTFYISHGGEGSSRNTRNTAFLRTINRQPVYRLGFSTTCAQPVATAGRKVQFQTLLFTYDGSPTYSVSTDMPWLKVTRNSSGTVKASGVDVYLEADATMLQPGTYKATVKAVGTGTSANYTQATYCVQLSVVAPSSTGSTAGSTRLAGGTNATPLAPADVTFSISTAPNPAKSATRILIHTAAPEPVNIWVMDGSGRVVQTLMRLPAQQQGVLLHTGHLSPGVYVIRASQAEKQAYTKLVIER